MKKQTKLFVILFVVLLLLSFFRSALRSNYTVQLRKNSPDNTIKTVTMTADKCSEECDKTDGCKGFVSYSFGDKCELKSTISNIVDGVGTALFIK